MKKSNLIIIITMLVVATVSSSAFAGKKYRGVQQTYIKDKFGEIDNDWCIPCACQFDTNRKRKGTYLPYDGYFWECTGHDENGFCEGVVRNSVMPTYGGVIGSISEECSAFGPTREMQDKATKDDAKSQAEADKRHQEMELADSKLPPEQRIKKLEKELAYWVKKKKETLHPSSSKDRIIYSNDVETEVMKQNIMINSIKEDIAKIIRGM